MLTTDHTDDLLESIPNLRRYAFCIVGQKDEGDALVENVLRKLPSAGPFLSGRSCSIGLFKTFNADVEVDVACRDAAAKNSWTIADALHSEILSLPVRHRQILILVKSIGFSCEDTAEIVPCPVTDVAPCVAEAVDCILQSSRAGLGDDVQHREPMTVPPRQARSRERVSRYGL